MANKKPKLSDLEIDKYSKSIKSKTKKEVFKKVINDERLKQRKTKSRTAAFEKLWEIGKTIVSRKYKGGSITTKNKRIANLVKESVFSETGIINELEKHDSKFRENSYEEFKLDLRNAEMNTYKERTYNFFKKYGDRTDNKGKSLNDYFSDYLNGKLSDRRMNNIIKLFQDVHLSDYDSSVYNSRKTRKAYSKKYK